MRLKSVTSLKHFFFFSFYPDSSCSINCLTAFYSSHLFPFSLPSSPTIMQSCNQTPTQFPTPRPANLHYTTTPLLSILPTCLFPFHTPNLSRFPPGRELSYVLPGDLLPGIVLDYLGLGGNRTRPIERLAPVNIHNKTSFGAKPIPDTILAPIPPECQVSLNAADAIVSYTEEEWATESKKLQELKQNDAAKQQQKREEFVQSHYDPQRQNKE